MERPFSRTCLGCAERLQRVAGASRGRSLRWLSAYLSIKAPHSGPLPWHQDWWCWDHPVTLAHHAPQVALLCYLTATDGHRGALRVIPGTHRGAHPLHRLAAATQGTPEPDDPVMVNQPDQLTIAADPGDAVLVDYRLLHGTHAHTGPEERTCLVLNFAPNWNSLPADVRGHLIQGWALPNEAESAGVDPVRRRWLPSFQGPRDDSGSTGCLPGVHEGAVDARPVVTDRHDETLPRVENRICEPRPFLRMEFAIVIPTRSASSVTLIFRLAA